MHSYYTTAKKTPSKKLLQSIPTKIISITLTLFLLLPLTILSITPTKTAHANFDPAQWVMCYFGPESPSAKVYQYATTDELFFEFRSKSAITPPISNVDSGLNWLLMTTGNNFLETNEKILGRELIDRPEEKTTTTPTTTDNQEKNNTTNNEKAQNYNKGPRVNPYDRFGVSGLNFTAYTGEWKYNIVQACNTNPTIKDPKTGLYYENRIVPETTWSGIPTTKDTRTEQLKKGFINQTLNSIFNNISNIIFSIAKLAVTLTIALINIAFTDLVHLLKIDTLIAGDNTNPGLFKLLTDNLFSPLIIIAFAFTGLNVFYQSVFKRQIRKSIIQLTRSILLFILAIIIAANPLFFIKLPNTIAISIQAVIVQTLNVTQTTQGELCATNVQDNTTNTNNNSPQQIIDQAGKNISSTIGCTLWQQLLFTPWAEGQFGRSWNSTWAENKIPDWAASTNKQDIPHTSKRLEEIIGNAPVPLGNDTIINNWALFQLSTQTNAHAADGLNGEQGKITNNLNNDWWRIVDIMSGYKEEKLELSDGGDTIKIDIPDPNAPPVDGWQTWIGNNPNERLATALSATLVATIAVLAPLIFAGISAGLSIGIGLLMALAPLALLAGCWGEKGWDIFLGWFQHLLRNITGRIMSGLLLVLSLMFVMAGLKLMSTTSWWIGVITMSLTSYALVKNRKTFFDLLNLFNFTNTELGTTAARLLNSTKGAITNTTKLGTSVVAGGVGSVASGGSFKTGAAAGLKNQVRNTGYRNRLLRETVKQYNSQDIKKQGQKSSEYKQYKECDECAKIMNNDELTARTPEGTYICEECMQYGLRPDAEYVTTQFVENQETLTSKQKIKFDSEKFNVDGTARKITKKIEEEITTHSESNGRKVFKVASNLKGYIPATILANAWARNDYDSIRELGYTAWAAKAEAELGEEYPGIGDALLTKIREEHVKMLQETTQEELSPKESLGNRTQSNTPEVIENNEDLTEEIIIISDDNKES